MSWKKLILAWLAAAVICSCAVEKPQDLVGTWYVGGSPSKACVISSGPKGFVAKNESGSTSKLSCESETQCTAVDWDGGVRGTVSKDHILWSNGTWWSRAVTR